MMDEMKRRCRRLTTEQKVILRDWLTDTIRLEESNPVYSPLRCSVLMGDFKDATGINITYHCRDAMQVWGRAMVAYQMYTEGYSTSEIGRQMMKDHSTIVNLRQKMENALQYPQAYKDIIPIWEKFKQRAQ